MLLLLESPTVFVYLDSLTNPAYLDHFYQVLTLTRPTCRATALTCPVFQDLPYRAPARTNHASRATTLRGPAYPDLTHQVIGLIRRATIFPSFRAPDSLSPCTYLAIIWDIVSVNDI